MSRLTKEEKEDQKFRKIEAEMEFDSLAKQYKGKPFSTEGICTLRRYWINIINYRILLFILNAVFKTLSELKLLENIKNEYIIIILAVLFFWYFFVMFVVQLHMLFLRIQRFRSIDLNPWIIFIPLYADFVSIFIPSKINFINNKYFTKKIKFKPIFITVMIIDLILLSFLSFFGILDVLIGET